jgi:hypothetical protein
MNNDKEFWDIIYRACCMVMNAIKKYKIGGGEK